MKRTVVVDIDGTLTKVGARRECLDRTPPDWDEFYRRCGEDTPVVEICDMVEQLSEDYTIVFCTGRPESCRRTTEDWLSKFVGFYFPDWYYLLMRKDGDRRHDTIVKPELLKVGAVNFEDIAFVLEDRNSMVKKWRELGLICLQVAEGNF